MIQRDELRPCTVKLRSYRTVNSPEIKKRVVKEAEIHKGYFHAWAVESYVSNGYLVGTTAGQMSTFYGVVEYEDGTVHKVPPECITFTDRNK